LRPGRGGCGIRRRRRGGFDHHRAVRVSRSAPALADVFRRAGLRGLSILGGLAASSRFLQNGSRGMSRILLAMLIDVAILGYPLSRFAIPQAAPIHDITTDPIDRRGLTRWRGCAPATAQHRGRMPGLYFRELQRAAYPDVEPVDIDVPVQRAYEVTLALVNKAQVADHRRARRNCRAASGRIEAVAPRRSWASRGRLDPHHPRRRWLARRFRSSSRYFETTSAANALAASPTDRRHQQRRRQGPARRTGLRR